jgi:dolichol-phosphate mannosyltransferase
MTDGLPGIRYSIVLPVFNEAAVVPILLRRLTMLMEQLDGPVETIFVDDGSSDCTPIVLQSLAREDTRFRYIGLSRNFGHQVAITAGMDAAAGEAVIVMDADLQDPPEVVQAMIAKWKEGFEVVYARRLSRAGESAFKRATANVFYKLLGRMSSVAIPADVGDFRLIDRKVLDAFRRMPEQDRFVRGMIAWLGFRQTRSHISSAAAVRGRNQVPAVQDGAAGGKRRTQLFRCPLAARDLGWTGRVSMRSALRVLCGRALADEQPPRRGMVINHYYHFVPLRHEHAHDRDYGPVYWPHPCRG